MKYILPLLLLCSTIVYSQTLVIGGGTSTISGLTDVDITAAADGDGLRHNGTDWVDTELFTPTTTDLLAARMSANWGAAGTTACATSGGVLYDNGTTIVCDADLASDGNTLTLGTGATKGIRFGAGASGFYEVSSNTLEWMTNSAKLLQASDVGYFIVDRGDRPGIKSFGQPSFYWANDADSGFGHVAPDTVGIYVGNVNTPFVTIGGSQTVLFKDPTASTGDTLVVVQGGAGESANVFEIKDNGGTVNAAITAAGVLAANSALIGPVGASRITGSAGFYQDIPEITPSGNPAVNTLRLYASSADDKLYLRDSAGTDFELGIAGGIGNAETIVFPLYNGGSVLAASVDDGDRIWVRMPFSCDITGVEVSADVSGSLVVDLWKDTYANFPPTNADSITASAPPTLSAAQKSQDTTLTDWTTQVNAGDYITANIDSATTVTNAVVAVQCTRD